MKFRFGKRRGAPDLQDILRDDTVSASDREALVYHNEPVPGKTSLGLTRPLKGTDELSLAYSPGVAVPSRYIAEHPTLAADLTNRGNLVAIISNGTAVLGLGDIGALASKPVMEGKAVLFKKFAHVDAFDIEINESDPEKLAEIIIRLEPTFGGVNLEDIKAPECFLVEELCRKNMNVPVFHDDQHGTAVVVAAGVENFLRATDRDIKEARLVCSGAGASALACLDMLVAMGFTKKNITVFDSSGPIHKGRRGLTSWKRKYANGPRKTTLASALERADIFLGLSIGGALQAGWIKQMTKAPLIMALANPDPEILPEVALGARSDAIICTGRSDYPNQVNNVLCFPFMFRGALDARASHITEGMKVAAAHAIAALGRASKDYPDGTPSLLPDIFNKELLPEVSAAVAQAAIKRKVAGRDVGDIGAYKDRLRKMG